MRTGYRQPAGVNSGSGTSPATQNSFWLPTATDKFYPDFVALLDDGRLLVVEYKGALTRRSADTSEKRTIGQLWERQSGGKGLFLVVEKNVDGKDMVAQLSAKVSAG